MIRASKAPDREAAGGEDQTEPTTEELDLKFEEILPGMGPPFGLGPADAAIADPGFDPESADPDTAVLLEPFSLRIHAVDREWMKTGNVIVVQGAGAISNPVLAYQWR